MSRRRFNEREVIETLAWQGVIIPCYRCKEPLAHITSERMGLLWPKGADIEREHITEIALGGHDVPHNCCYSHGECHARVTNGTKATSAGSSKHRIAKVKRIANGGRPRNGPPMKSRGFDKTKSRKMDGTTVRRECMTDLRGK